MPELAVSLATAGQVIFVDAAKGAGSIHAEEIKPTHSTQAMTHAVDPRALLQLTKIIYERCPTALSLTIPAEDFSFGRKFSKISRRGIEAALSRIRALAIGPRGQIRVALERRMIAPARQKLAH
jgi:Ni,Fe-hydrogenase maturation factor